MFDRIVVGYAGDQAGRDAVKLAANLAGALNSDVTVVYPFHPLFAPAPFDVVEARVRGELQELLCDIDGLREMTFHWSSASWPIHAVHELASYERADLVVFGAAREGLARHLHVGFVQRMAHGAPCAVAIAPTGYADTEHTEVMHIGVGFSDTREGTAAAYLAHELASLFGGDLELIAAAAVSSSEATYAASAGLLPRLEDEVHAQTEAELRQLAGGLGDSVTLRVEVERSQPAPLLVARTESLDLLVLGSRAYGPFRYALLGSVSAEVIPNARCPVVVVPRGTPQRAVESGRDVEDREVPSGQPAG